MSDAVNFLVVAGAAALCARLCLAGLHRRYKALVIFLIFFILQNGILGVLSQKSTAYEVVWMVTEPVEWFLYFWIVLELYARVLKDYQGLYTVGRWSLTAAVGVALLISGISLMLPTHATQQGRLVAFYYVTERSVYLSLVVFLVTILVLLTRYPITLNRNTMVHSVVFSAYFLSNTAIFLLLSTHDVSVVRFASYAIQAVNLGALGTWLAMLSAAGEQRAQKLRPSWMPGREEDLVNQLNNLNAALLRVTRT